MAKFIVWDESGVMVCIEANDAEEACREYVDDGDFTESSSTQFHDLRYVDVAEAIIDGDMDDVAVGYVDDATVMDDPDIYHHTVTVDPKEPACSSKKGHKWVQETVRGNGGGVVIVERCKRGRCGLTRTVNTWDTNPSNGQQGFTTLSYSNGE